MTDSERGQRIPLELDLPLLPGLEEECGSETSELGYCLVTGGAGYLGRNIAFELIRRGATVRIFDRQKIDFSHDRLDFVSGDIRKYEDVRKACEGIETVFHTAAVMNFLGFATGAQRDESFSVNAGGVANIVRACQEAGVKRLIHTSTNNVTFGGPVLDGDESSPYAEDPQDLYTESKILGEKVALEANGRGGLLTCAIRPGGIYGPNDQLLLTRVAEECARGMFVACFGDGTAKSDNSFIDNLVDGQLEAARHLTTGSPVCGEAYFITDGVHINYFDFFKPFVEGMGFKHPRIRLLDHHFAVDLITERPEPKPGDPPPRCHGAWVLDTATGEVHAMPALVTILATGGSGKVYLYTTNDDVSTGDGLAMAYRAGCRVSNVEFYQFHPTCLFHPHAKSFLISEAVRGEGGRLIGPDGREPSFESVLRTMFEAGYRGDVYPSLGMWERAPTGVYATYPFPESLDVLRRGRF